MSRELSQKIYENGRSHGLAAELIYKGAIAHAEENGIDDAEGFAFNGIYSLALLNSIGLCFELFLKSACVHHGNVDEKYLQNEIRHDLIKALSAANELGFVSTADHLEEIITLLNEAYKFHTFRYDRPDKKYFASMVQTFAAIAQLDEELTALLFPATQANAPTD